MTWVHQEAMVRRALCRVAMVHKVAMAQEADLTMMSTVHLAMAHRAAIMARVAMDHLQDVAAHRETMVLREITVLHQVVEVHREAMAARAVTATATIAVA